MNGLLSAGCAVVHGQGRDCATALAGTPQCPVHTEESRAFTRAQGRVRRAPRVLDASVLTECTRR